MKMKDKKEKQIKETIEEYFELCRKEKIEPSSMGCCLFLAQEDYLEKIRNGEIGK